MTPEGYDAPIAPGLWQRVCTYGVPNYWFAAWVSAAILQGLVVGYAWLRPVLGVLNSFTVVGLAVAGELMLLQALTRHDPHWDTALLLTLWYGWARAWRAR